MRNYLIAIATADLIWSSSVLGEYALTRKTLEWENQVALKYSSRWTFPFILVHDSDFSIF